MFLFRIQWTKSQTLRYNMFPSKLFHKTTSQTMCTLVKYVWHTNQRKHLLSFIILFYSRLCPCTAGSSPAPESPNFVYPCLSLSIPLPVAPQCHLSNDVVCVCVRVRCTRAQVFLSLLVHMCIYNYLYIGMCIWTRLPTDLTPFICHSVLLIVHLLSFTIARTKSPVCLCPLGKECPCPFVQDNCKDQILSVPLYRMTVKTRYCLFLCTGWL